MSRLPRDNRLNSFFVVVAPVKQHVRKEDGQFAFHIVADGAALAVGFAFILRGRGGGRDGSLAGQGDLFPDIADPGKA